MQLFLVRHADSAFENQPDHQRPLSALGQTQAKQTATYLKHVISATNKQTQEQPTQKHTHIIASDATRTHSTAQIIQQQLPHCSLTIDNTYYQAHVGDWSDAILDHLTVSHLILVGHNPIISMLSKFLDPSQRKNFSPSCVAQYRLEIISDGLKLPAQFIDFFRPDAT